MEPKTIKVKVESFVESDKQQIEEVTSKTEPEVLCTAPTSLSRDRRIINKEINHVKVNLITSFGKSYTGTRSRRMNLQWWLLRFATGRKTSITH